MRPRISISGLVRHDLGKKCDSLTSHLINLKSHQGPVIILVILLVEAEVEVELAPPPYHRSEVATLFSSFEIPHPTFLPRLLSRILTGIG